MSCILRISLIHQYNIKIQCPRVQPLDQIGLLLLHRNTILRRWSIDVLELRNLLQHNTSLTKGPELKSKYGDVLFAPIPMLRISITRNLGVFRCVVFVPLTLLSTFLPMELHQTTKISDLTKIDFSNNPHYIENCLTNTRICNQTQSNRDNQSSFWEIF